MQQAAKTESEEDIPHQINSPELEEKIKNSLAFLLQQVRPKDFQKLYVLYLELVYFLWRWMR